MRILVTGASGFVGSHVVRALVTAGHEVTALARPASSFWRSQDLGDRLTVVRSDMAASSPLLAPLEGWRPEVCIHLAWYAVPGVYLEARDNIDSLVLSLRLLEELAAVGCGHVVMTGSCAEYDTEVGILREDGPVRPATLYAAAKLAANLIGAQRAAQVGIGFAWARLFYLYGPFEDERRLVPSLIQSLLDGKEFAATAGTQVRDYLHVEDVASAICALALQKVGGVYNVCSGEKTPVASLLTEVARIAGRPDLIRLGALPYRGWEPMFICGDNGRLKAATGWAPRQALTEGLAGTVAWWKEFRASARPQIGRTN
jgi:nucleoside-diphosphate-sugar epimerase